MGGGEEGGTIPLLTELPQTSDESKPGHFERSGTVWTGIAHIITAVIGSGVLSLAWSMAQLGWAAGPIAMVSFAMITMFQSTLLADCYRSPDPDHGHLRNTSYMEAVKRNLGGKRIWFCGLCQFVNLYGAGIAYTITTANSIRYWITT